MLFWPQPITALTNEPAAPNELFSASTLLDELLVSKDLSEQEAHFTRTAFHLLMAQVIHYEEFHEILATYKMKTRTIRVAHDAAMTDLLVLSPSEKQ